MNPRPSLMVTAFAACGLIFSNASGAEKEGAPQIGQTLNFKTENGREMNHAILRRIEPDGLTFETKTGLEKLPLSSLPEELAVHFKFERAEVVRYVEQQRAISKALAARQAAEAAEAEKKAAQQKAAAPATPPPRPAAPAEPRLGAQGEKSLGSPRLGGRGAGK